MNKIKSILLLLIGFSIIGQANTDNCLYKINKDKYLENDDSCDIDSIPPTFTLLNGRLFELDYPYNKSTIFPKDLITAAQDNCTDSVDLIYKFWHSTFLAESPDSTSLSNRVNVVDSLNLSEDNLGTNQIHVVVYDQKGNYAYLPTYLVISCQDCDEDPLPYHSFAGRTINSFGIPIDSVKMEVSIEPALELYTNEHGIYRFSTEQGKDFYKIEPIKDSNPLLGVTAFDLLLIQKHVLGLQPFDNPYKFLAADVDFSGTVSTFDIITIKKIILGKEATFPTGQTWVFTLGDFEFITYNPASENYPTTWMTSSPPLNNENINFIGIKLGDINDDALPFEKN